MVFPAHDVPPAAFRTVRPIGKAKPVVWRFADQPRTGTIYRLPDDMRYQRGITYTFLPDGRSIRVPAMNRLDVRAAAQGHQENEDKDIVAALQQLLTGKHKKDEAQFDSFGRASKAHDRRRPHMPVPRRDVHGDGLRPI